MDYIERIKKRFQLTAGLKSIRERSPLTFAIERVFFILQFTSPANLAFGTRQDAHEKPQNKEQMREIIRWRGKRMDCYILSWAIILIAAAFLAPFAGSHYAIAVFCIVAPFFRVFEIMQTTVNIILFDHLRISKEHSMSAITRTLVLCLWNYLEIVFSFGIVYCVLFDHIAHATQPLHGFYFSAISQLTIGYGDMCPCGPLKIIAPIQGIVGFIFAVLVIARFVTSMPEISSLQKAEQGASDDKKNDGQENMGPR